jgi:hypothetical protein
LSVEAPRLVHCHLPTLPKPIALNPNLSDDHSHATITVTEMRDLLQYLAELRAWVASASACVQAQERQDATD